VHGVPALGQGAGQRGADAGVVLDKQDHSHDADATPSAPRVGNTGRVLSGTSVICRTAVLPGPYSARPEVFA
jgi:hypothetical protein